jgi:hypothetical protein
MKNGLLNFDHSENEEARQIGPQANRNFLELLSLTLEGNA